MNESKSCKVVIFGQEYSLVTHAADVHLLEATGMVDALMYAIAEQGKLRDSSRIAVLAALRLAHTVVQLETEIKKRKKDEMQLAEVIDRELADSGAMLVANK